MNRLRSTGLGFDVIRQRHTKVLATLGPASDHPERLKALVDIGADAFRLNFSHGAQEEAGRRVETIRDVEKAVGAPIPIVADLQGPKIRCGVLPGDAVQLRIASEVGLELAKESSDESIIPIPHPELFEAIQPGDELKLDDGNLQLTIVDVAGERATARVDIPGKLENRKGINLPGRSLPISALTEKDRSDLAYALDAGVDYVALSFVQRPEDVQEAIELTKGRVGIISKIEKPNAVDAIRPIAELSDSILIARGDLGVELPLEQVPVVQRQIVRESRRLGKPVIVATQMLQSMVDSPTPTRAEASDIATAVYLGADMVMLSAESAVGRHPLTAVAVMDRIIRAVEADDEHWRELARTAEEPEATPASAISVSVRHIASLLDCSAIVAFTKTGSTAFAVARERPKAPIIGLTTDVEAARRIALLWGVRSVVAEEFGDFEGLSDRAREIAMRQLGGEAQGSSIAVVAGIPLGEPGGTNTLKIIKTDAA